MQIPVELQLKTLEEPSKTGSVITKTNNVISNVQD